MDRSRKARPEFSKQLISDIRALLWVVTVGGLLLAAYCAVVCILNRRLWREKAPEHYVNIYVLPDGREIRKEEWK